MSGPSPALRRGTLPRAVVRHRRWIAIGWALACVAIAPFARHLDRRLVPAGRVPGSESERVEQLLSARFGSPFARYAVLVVSGIDVRDPSGLTALGEIVAALDTLPVVSNVFSPLTSSDTLLIGTGGSGALVVAGLVPGGRHVDPLVAELRRATVPAAVRLKADHPGLTLRWTGEDALNVDLRRASSIDVRQSEARALPVTVLLLFLAFGGVVAALLPIAAAIIAIVLSYGIGALLAARHPTSLLYPNVVSLLGLALGIDYALLIVSRFRDARRAGHDSEPAAEIAVTHAGRTVALSGAAVAVGFAALLVVPLGELRSIGAGGVVVAGVSVLVATTLLPGILVWLGDRVGRAGMRSAARQAGTAARWERWGTFVTGRPWATLVLASLPLIALAWQVRRMNIALPSVDWLPPTAESAIAYRDLDRMGRGYVLQNVRVLLILPDGSNALSPSGWAATKRLEHHLAQDQHVSSIRSLPTYASGAPLVAVRAGLPDSVRQIFMSSDSSIALLEATPRSDLRPAAASVELVRALRGADAPAVTGLAGSRLLVGGLAASNVDYEDVVGGQFKPVVSLVLAGTFLALLAGFRSVLVPMKAIAMNLLTVAATCGAVVLVFQDGVGAGALGLAEPLDAVFPTLPILVFCAVFAIGMDYEVFLIARVAEARHAGFGERDAIVRGLATTGGVITSAAAIMIAVFGAFSLGGFLPTKMLGFALAVAVFLDATLVRLAIGPALLQLAGRWNWWPGSAVEKENLGS